jgi:hypothetical protein
MEELHPSATTTRRLAPSGKTQAPNAWHLHPIAFADVPFAKKEGEDPRPPEARGRAPLPVRQLDPPRESSPKRHLSTATASSVVNVITVPARSST